MKCDQVSRNWKKYRYRDPVEEIFTQTFTTLGRGQTLPFEIPVVFEYDVVQPAFMKMLHNVQVYNLYTAGASQGEESRKIVLAPISVVLLVLSRPPPSRSPRGVLSIFLPFPKVSESAVMYKHASAGLNLCRVSFSASASVSGAVSR